jgi:hypothetical protein
MGWKAEGAQERFQHRGWIATLRNMPFPASELDISHLPEGPPENGGPTSIFMSITRLFSPG